LRTFYEVLAAIGVVMIVVYLFRMRLRSMRGAERSRAKVKHVAREKERDLQACRAAARSLESDSAPGAYDAAQDAIASSGATAPGPRSTVESRRRAAYSTAFDPDLPGAT